MADDDKLGPLGGSILGAAVALLGLLIVLPTALAERRIDLRDTCGPTETGKCFVHENGIVETAEYEGVKILHDDGRKSAEVSLVGDTHPAPRARVRLERWNGDIVSIFDLSTERRYRTIKWPDADTSVGWAFILAGGFVLAWSLWRGLYSKLTG